MNRPPLSGRCPQCSKPALLEASNSWRPFCCERCKLLDLGEWFAGRHAIPVEPDPESDLDGLHPERLQ